MKTTTLIAFSLLMGTAGIASVQAQSADSATGRHNVDSLAPTPQSDSYAGMWLGMLKNSSGPHRVALDVARSAMTDNSVAANVVTSAQSPFSVLVDTFDVQGSHVTLKMRTAGTAFEGTANRAMTEIRGVWKQDGIATPLTLRRMDASDRADKNNARGLQSQIAQTGTTSGETDPTPAPPTRRQPVFRIGPPNYYAWYAWTNPIGNQERPYGAYYW